MQVESLGNSGSIRPCRSHRRILDRCPTAGSRTSPSSTRLPSLPNLLRGVDHGTPNTIGTSTLIPSKIHRCLLGLIRPSWRPRLDHHRGNLIREVNHPNSNSMGRHRDRDTSSTNRDLLRGNTNRGINSRSVVRVTRPIFEVDGGAEQYQQPQQYQQYPQQGYQQQVSPIYPGFVISYRDTDGR